MKEWNRRRTREVDSPSETSPLALRCCAFGRSDIAETVHEGDRLDVVARLTSRSFGGFESLQLDIRDVATAGAHATATVPAEAAPALAGSIS